MQVNYRGSLGFGEAPLQSLPGNIGTNDVSDMLAAVDAAVDLGVAKEGALAGAAGGTCIALWDPVVDYRRWWVRLRVLS